MRLAANGEEKEVVSERVGAVGLGTERSGDD